MLRYKTQTRPGLVALYEGGTVKPWPKERAVPHLPSPLPLDAAETAADAAPAPLQQWRGWAWSQQAPQRR